MGHVTTGLATQGEPSAGWDPGGRKGQCLGTPQGTTPQLGGQLAEALPLVPEGQPVVHPGLRLVEQGPPHGGFTQPPAPDSTAHTIRNPMGMPRGCLTTGLSSAASRVDP